MPEISKDLRKIIENSKPEQLFCMFLKSKHEKHHFLRNKFKEMGLRLENTRDNNVLYFSCKKKNLEEIIKIEEIIEITGYKWR